MSTMSPFMSDLGTNIKLISDNPLNNFIHKTVNKNSSYNLENKLLQQNAQNALAESNANQQGLLDDYAAENARLLTNQTTNNLMPSGSMQDIISQQQRKQIYQLMRNRNQGKLKAINYYNRSQINKAQNYEQLLNNGYNLGTSLLTML